MVGPSPAPPWAWKEGMCSADLSRSVCLRGRQSVQSTLPLWNNPLSIPLGLHLNGSCQKRKSQSVKQQARASSPENRVGGSIYQRMIHIQTEWEQWCCLCFNDLWGHGSCVLRHVCVTAIAVGPCLLWNGLLCRRQSWAKHHKNKPKNKSTDFAHPQSKPLFCFTKRGLLCTCGHFNLQDVYPKYLIWSRTGIVRWRFSMFVFANLKCGAVHLDDSYPLEFPFLPVFFCFEATDVLLHISPGDEQQHYSLHLQIINYSPVL